jgi:hypothetical protein
MPGLPCAILASYIQNLSIGNFHLRWEKPGAVWREGILLTDVQDIDLDNVQLRQPQLNAGAAINCQDVQNVTLRNSRAASGTSTFLYIDNDDKSTFVCYGGNDFSQAQTPLAQSGQPVELIPFSDLE